MANQQVFKTDVTELLGIQHPVILAGMNAVAHAELVAAVSNAGGLGKYHQIRTVRRGYAYWLSVSLYVDVMGYSNGCGGPLGEVGHSVWGWRGAGDRSRQRVEGSGGVCSVGTLHDACTREGALNAADKKCNFFLIFVLGSGMEDETMAVYMCLMDIRDYNQVQPPPPLTVTIELHFKKPYFPLF